jgi:hypothetical protein
VRTGYGENDQKPASVHQASGRAYKIYRSAYVKPEQWQEKDHIGLSEKVVLVANETIF